MPTSTQCPRFFTKDGGTVASGEGPTAESSHVDGLVGSRKKERRKKSRVKVKDMGVDNSVACAFFAKGDSPGHDFHGNQYTGPLYHATTSDAADHIRTEGFKPGNLDDRTQSTDTWVTADRATADRIASRLPNGVVLAVKLDDNAKPTVRSIYGDMTVDPSHVHYANQSWNVTDATNSTATPELKSAVRHWTSDHPSDMSPEDESVLTNAMHSAPPSPTPLYRGLHYDTVAPEFRAKYVQRIKDEFPVDGTVTIPMSSWTDKLDEAEGFAKPMYARDNDPDAPGGVVITTAPGAHHLPINSVVDQEFGYENEHVVTGDFHVDEVTEEQGGRINIHLTPVVKKGEGPGHPFHGNQYTGGRGGANTPETYTSRPTGEFYLHEGEWYTQPDWRNTTDPDERAHVFWAAQYQSNALVHMALDQLATTGKIDTAQVIEDVKDTGWGQQYLDLIMHDDSYNEKQLGRDIANSAYWVDEGLDKAGPPTKAGEPITMYRGDIMPRKDMLRYFEPGKSFMVGPTSFTPDEISAEDAITGHAAAREGMNRNTRDDVYVTVIVKKPLAAMNLDASGIDMGMNEWLMRGKFRVDKVENISSSYQAQGATREWYEVRVTQLDNERAKDTTRHAQAA